MSAPPPDDDPAPYRGGCRPGMAGCRRRCGHRAIVEGYREARDAQAARAEIESVGYETELASFYDQHPKMTFRRWLEQLADGRRYEEAEAA